jgi:predicted nucleotidyltransferase
VAKGLIDFSQEYNEPMSMRLQKIEQIARKYRAKALYVFGSRSLEIFYAIQNDALEIGPSGSDVDIGVLTHSPLSVDEKVSLTRELEDLFNEPRVDLVLLQEADAFLAANVIRGERLYAEDSYLADEYDLFVLRRAGDLADLERQRMAMILRGG